MNKFTITIELETYSDSPEDWITESIIDQLEDDESLVSLTVENGHTVEEPMSVTTSPIDESTGWN